MDRFSSDLQANLKRRLAQPAKPPPDYTQRNIKLKIFGLLAALMAVLFIAEKSRDPQAWNWLWELDKRATSTGEKFDNRLAPPPLRTANDAPGTFVASSERPKPAEEASAPTAEKDAANRPAFDPVARAWSQGWKEVFNRLDHNQRTLLFEILYVADRRQSLPTERVPAAGELVTVANRAWEEYQVAAFQSIAVLGKDDQTQWVDVLRQVNRRWSTDVMPSLQAVIDGRTPTENEEIALAGFQKTLDELAMNLIEDDTLFLRPNEREIWLRWEGQVRDTPAAEFAKQSVGPVSYLQLYKQSKEFRGKVVTLRGTIKEVHAMPAGTNYLGVAQHYVFWMLPEGGPASPIIIYAQGLPPGFPEITERNSDRAAKLHEPAVVHGVFLKRGAYLAKDGTYTGPLLLANVPEWSPRESLLGSSSRFASGPGWLVQVMLAAAAISIVAFLAIQWRIRSNERAVKRAIAESAVADKAALANLTVRPSAAEALKQLEDEAGH